MPFLPLRGERNANSTCVPGWRADRDGQPTDRRVRPPAADAHNRRVTVRRKLYFARAACGSQARRLAVGEERPRASEPSEAFEGEDASACCSHGHIR